MITNDDIEALDDRNVASGDRVPIHTIHALWLSGFVRRWHANDDWRLRDSGDTNGGHAQRVAILYSCLFNPTVEGLLCCLLHDAPEVISGDIPAPGKRLVDTLYSGDRESAALFFGKYGVNNWSAKTDEVNLCDLLDAILFTKKTAPDLLDREDWSQDIHVCIDMAQKLGVRQTVWCVINWPFRPHV